MCDHLGIDSADDLQTTSPEDLADHSQALIRLARLEVTVSSSAFPRLMFPDLLTLFLASLCSPSLQETLILGSSSGARSARMLSSG
jgi:hypothetical protein